MIEHYIRGFEEELREIRHQIHENPELGLQEFKTSALVARKSCASGAMRLSKGWRQPAW